MTTSLGGRATRPYAQRLYELLPAIYRAADTNGELQVVLAVLGHELDLIRANADQLLDDLFVDSCQPWVLPYLGDLVGADVLDLDDPARVRADIKNTIRWRRRKGTLGGLEDIVAQVTGRGARVVEMLERVLWSQRLDHLRPSSTHALDLRSPHAMSRLSTAFDESARTIDLRPTAGRDGRHRPRALSVHLWPLLAIARRGSDVSAAGGGRWRLDPLGRDVALFANRAARTFAEDAGTDAWSGSDIGAPHTEDLPVRGRDLDEHPLVYFGAPGGFTVYEDGIPLCRTSTTRPSQSLEPALRWTALRTAGGLLVADASQFAAADAFRLRVVRYGVRRRVENGATLPVPPNPGRDFAGNYELRGEGGRVDLPANAWTAGLPFTTDAPAFHQAPLLLAIERMGAAAAWPESEVIVRAASGESLLVYLPALPGLSAGTPLHLWVASDGSTYYARDLHDAGAPHRNPDSELFGAFLPQHLARAAQGQARPRPGTRPLRFREARFLPLRCWERPLVAGPANGEVAFDPATGRMAVPAGEAPTGELTADYRHGRTADVGAGPFFRPSPLDATLTVSRDRPADFVTIAAAVASIPNLAARPVVIEILDSRTYAETIDLAGVRSDGGLILRAAPGETPVVRAPGGPVVSCTATTRLGMVSLDGAMVGGLELQGLILVGGAISVRGRVSRIAVEQCTLAAGSVPLDLDPSLADVPCRLARTLAGALIATAAIGSLEITDSVVQHPSVTAIDHGTHRAIACSAAARIERSTILGAVRVTTLHLSNAIVWGGLELADPDGSCLRHARWTPGTAAIRGFACTFAVPVFLALEERHPAFVHLHPAAAPALRTGGEHGSEMGVWNGAGLPRRLAHLAHRLDEYVPAGLEVALVRELPSCGHSGELRP